LSLEIWLLAEAFFDELTAIISTDHYLNSPVHYRWRLLSPDNGHYLDIQTRPKV